MKRSPIGKYGVWCIIGMCA